MSEQNAGGVLRKRLKAAYRTEKGRMYRGKAEEVLNRQELAKLKGRVQLIFTSPPFPLNRKKRYGNVQGDEYISWLADFAPLFADLLTADGSIVLELGNAWVPGSPTMSTLSIKALLAFQERGNLHLCQEFICFNPARLPSPAQWVNVERIRVKDAFTRVWWLSSVSRPKADNRKIPTWYSRSMEKLLRTGTYNSGPRPSQHHIGGSSFNRNNGGAIPPNVLVPAMEVLPISNTVATDIYQTFCRLNGLQQHPARMPEKLVEFFVKFLTDTDDLVLDPFAGSNATGAVAEGLGRRWIAVEAEKEYVRSSKGRFERDRASDAVGGRPSGLENALGARAENAVT
jgi:site-specific DNA-methyltransferase (cytosine-N4-specific)